MSVAPTAASLGLPAIPELLMKAPLLALPVVTEVAKEIDAQILDLEIDLLGQKKDISNRSLGYATDSVVAGFTCDRSILFHKGVDNIGNVMKEEDDDYELRVRARETARALANGEEAPVYEPMPVNEYRRDDDATMAKKCETLINLRKARAKLLAEKVYILDKNDNVLEQYYATVEKYVIDNKISQKDAEEAVELAMRLFISENYTGELSNVEVDHFRPLLCRFSYVEALEERFVSRLLTTDGEMPTPAIVLPALLLFAVALVSVGRRFEDAKNEDGTPAPQALPNPDALVRFENTNIWRLRVLYRHQLCLLHRSHTLFLQIADCVDALLMSEQFNTNPRILVEVGYVQNYYHKVDLAAENFFKAMKLTGLEFEEDTMLGVRTKWQTAKVAQRVLKARSSTDDGLVGDESLALPKIIESEKDAEHGIYDYPRASAEETGILSSDKQALAPLSVTDKAIILALCLNIRNTNPLHGLVNHHVQIYLERLVVDPATPVWIETAQMLLLRSRAEKERSRVAQRSFLQVQELLDQFTTRREPNLPTFYRSDSNFFYLVNYPSIWSLRREFADFCFDESLFKTALELFESIHDFDNVIKCCKKLDKRRRAENLARDLLETDPSNPMLWVAVGESTREDKYLWKAWELSNQKMAAPMRALARMALDREQYDKVIEYFNIATRLNPIFGGDWFSLGFASMKLKNLEQGAVAFTRVCQIDPNDSYAWNNLGSMLLQQGKTRPAFNAISQGLRNNRRSWRMWQNYFSIAVDLLEVTEATHALAILLDLGGRSVKLDPDTMTNFTNSCIRYMKGEIGGTDNDAFLNLPKEATEEGEDASAATNTLRDGVVNAESAAIPHFNTEAGVANADDDEDAEIAMDLQAFGADVEMPETYFPEKAAKKAEEEEERRKALAKRFRDRLKLVFRQITDMFVNDADLYACVATLHRFTDGPIDAFKFREKEYRVNSQVDQVYRDAEKFARLVKTINVMSADAIAMLAEAANPTAAADSTSSTNAEEAEKEQKKAASPQQLMKDAVDAVKKCVGHVDAAAELSAEHLEEHEGNRTLQIVRRKLNTAIKEANAKK